MEIITARLLAVPGWLARVGICTGLGLASPFVAQAADHGDAPLVSNDQGADIADVYAFLDPNDNDYLVTIITARGFITPGESENFGFFQEDLNWRFAIESDGVPGDASPNFNAEVTFAPRKDFLEPQNSFVSLRKGSDVLFSFEAPTTPPSAGPDAPDFVVTHDADSDITFFAGMVDDPFFFDVPAELQFRTSLLNSDEIGPGETIAPGIDLTAFRRRMDTFAGFNVMAVALRIPLELIDAVGMAKVPGVSIGLGVSGYTELPASTMRSREFGVVNDGSFVNIDRMGIPGINTVLLPYFDESCFPDCVSPKDTYNRGSTGQDAAGVYAAFIVSALQDLKTNDANIAFLAELAVNNGDILRLDTTVSNRGRQGGRILNKAAAFPNGRRLTDDVIDTVVNIISNQAFDGPPLNGRVDRIDRNDKRFGNEFPFLATPHQPEQRLSARQP